MSREKSNSDRRPHPSWYFALIPFILFVGFIAYLAITKYSSEDECPDCRYSYYVKCPGQNTTVEFTDWDSGILSEKIRVESYGDNIVLERRNNHEDGRFEVHEVTFPPEVTGYTILKAGLDEMRQYCATREKTNEFLKIPVELILLLRHKIPQVL